MFPLSKLRWYARWPVKLMIVLFTLVAVSFPYPGRLWTHIRRWQDPNALVEPDAPEIQPLVEELRPQLEREMPPKEALDTVQKRVLEELPYSWDWVNWGNADYIPTVHEAMARGTEDCDGRAVVAASVLQNLGYEAELVSDFTHVWVKTNKGETMGPRKHKAIVATPKGPQIQAGFLKDLLPAIGYGIRVFPWQRELILLLVVWYLSMRPRGGAMSAFLGLVLLLNGWLFLRASGLAWAQLVGLFNIIFSLGLMASWGATTARRRKNATDVNSE